MPYDTTKRQWVYHHTYEDVKAYRESIARDRERLETYEPDSREAFTCLESIERLEGWIEEAGYTVEPKASETPTSQESKNPRGSQATTPPKDPLPNYTAYFRLDDGTVDAYDFYAVTWIAASKQAWKILNRDYREWIEVEPYTVVRGKETFVCYARGKRPVGKRFAEIIGLKLREAAQS